MYLMLCMWFYFLLKWKPNSESNPSYQSTISVHTWITMSIRALDNPRFFHCFSSTKNVFISSNGWITTWNGIQMTMVAWKRFTFLRKRSGTQTSFFITSEQNSQDEKADIRGGRGSPSALTEGLLLSVGVSPLFPLNNPYKPRAKLTC